MDIRPIRTEADYQWAIDQIAAYFENEPVPGSTQADRFDVLASLIKVYEDRHWPVPNADPITVIGEVMTAQGRTQNDLARLLGARSRASELLNRKRPLTLGMIQKLSREWSIPAGALISSYELKGAA